MERTHILKRASSSSSCVLTSTAWSSLMTGSKWADDSSTWAVVGSSADMMVVIAAQGTGEGGRSSSQLLQVFRAV